MQVWGLYNYEENELMEAGHPTGLLCGDGGWGQSGLESAAADPRGAVLSLNSISSRQAAGEAITLPPSASNH